jgi:hypothetical protein
MRDYFKNLLQHLDKLTGLKQYEKLLQTTNPKEEIKLLLDILCRVTDQFPFIPDEDKKRIIDDAVVADPEFIGLNAKIIFKWLNHKKANFFQEMAHKENAPSDPPLEGEALQKRLAEWQEALAKLETNCVERVDIYQTVREQWNPREGTTKYQPTKDAVKITEHQRHLDWIKANYDARTGKPLPTWISEEEYNRQQL